MCSDLKPAVKALIQRDGKILVLRTETENNVYWVLPGGKVEYGEHPLETLKRELEEELSVNTEISDSVGMYHFFLGDNDDGDQVVLTVFEASIQGKIDISSNPAEDENITEYRWLTPEELISKSSNDSLHRLINENYID